MGTSSSYGGATGKNSLLPSWAQDANGLLLDVGNIPSILPPSDLTPAPDGGSDNEQPDSPPAPPSEVPQSPTPPNLIIDRPSVSWSAAKRGVTAFTSSRGDRAKLRSAANRYVGARGGGKLAAQSAIAGRVSTANFGRFLSSVAAGGIAEAAKTFGLVAHLGHSIDQVLAAISNLLAPAGATQEEAVARQAINDALDHLYQKYGLENGDITRLDALDRDGVIEAVAISVMAYIYHRWLQELGKKIEENAYTASEAVRLERDVKLFIDETVLLDMSRVDPLSLDWSGPAGQQFVQQIYTNAYEMLEGE